MTKRKAADALKRPTLPPINRGKPIRASELVARRAAEAATAFERAIEKREQAITALMRANAKVWQCARQVKRYEKLIRG